MQNSPPAPAGTSELDTTPKLLLHHARTNANRPAFREKDLGIWQTSTWSQVCDEVLALAGGLAGLGFQPGDRLAVVGDNRPQLYWAMIAAQCVDGIPVPVYQDSVADEMQYVLDHAEIRFAIVEDQEQVDKLLEIKEKCPSLEYIIYKDTRGMRHYDQPFVLAYTEVQERGRTYNAENPDYLRGLIAKGKGSDVATMVYTSGTTGRSKGVVLSHDNIVITARNAGEEDGLRSDDQILAYLPMAWIGDFIFSMGQAFVFGFCVNCPESGDTVLTDMREIGPTYYFAPPRVFENLLTTVTIRIEDAGPIKQRMYHYFMAVAKRVGIPILDGQQVSLGDRLLYGLGELFVYGPLKNVLGFSRLRIAYTAGEAIGPDIFDFYRSLGLNLKQIYGSTEASVFITVQPDGKIRPDTVGEPARGVELQIADNGEVLFRSPGVFVEYYKDEKATVETKDAEGWVHTGDAGYIDNEGQLKIIDRAKDVGKLNDGSMFAPKYLENKLKFFPHIKEAVTFGDGRDNVCAFINIDLEAVGNWAERQGLAYSGYTDLAGQSTVYDMITDCVNKVNADLANDPHLGTSQIKRFLILHKELDADDGELTRTRKVRRRIVAERYADLIAALYSDRDEVHVEAEVTFEDGRKGRIDADLQIRDAETFTPGLSRAS